jgi:hypothetical protein
MSELPLYRLEYLGIRAYRNDRGLGVEPRNVKPQVGELPKSCLGPDGRIMPMSQEERRCRSEALRMTLDAIAELLDDDPPEAFAEFMRGIDEGRRHRPMFKGMY